MLEAALANFVDSVTEREFDAPFMSLLRSNGFIDIHFTHGSYEFGKDFVAKHSESGLLYQYVFQSKAGNANLQDWAGFQPQLDLLRRNEISHPSFDRSLPRKAVFLITGRLVGGAMPAAQDYCRQATERGEVELEVWDRERLIELMLGTINAPLADHARDPVLGILAAADNRTITDSVLQRYSSQWCIADQPAPAAALLAAIVAARLHRSDRTDLACYTGLALVRAACWHRHGTGPVDADWQAAAVLGRGLFASYAETLCTKLKDGGPYAPELIRAHHEGAALITHSARCVRLVETLGLLGLMPADEQAYGRPHSAEIAAWLSTFLRRQKSAASIISDRWAVAVIPAVLLLAKGGYRERARDYLRDLLLWIAQRYGKGLGLAGTDATPLAEVQQVIGDVVPNPSVTRRDESYLSSLILELAGWLRFEGLYQLAHNEFSVIGAATPALTTLDSPGQYLLAGDGVSYEPNVRYASTVPHNWTGVAPHLVREAAPRYLQSIGQAWDHLAVSAVLRDRHFVCSWNDLGHGPSQ